MKKFLALLLSIAMLVIPMSAFAADITADVDYIANKVTIADQVDAGLAGRLATLIIVNPGMDIDNFAEDGVIAWADQCVVAADGSFEFEVDMTYTGSGSGYGVYVTVSGSDEVFEGTFNYSRAQIDITLINAANDMTLKAAMDVFIRETAKNAIDEIDEDIIEKYIALKKEDKVAEAMIEERPYTDMEDFVDTLKDEVEKQKKAEKKSSGGGGGGGGNSLGLYVEPSVIVEVPEVVNPFYDITDGYWGKDCILNLYEKDIVSGDGNGYFRPNDTITRAEFVQMVVKAFGFGMNGEEPAFNDVPADAWYKKAVNVAYTNGVVNGTSGTTFSPEENITRQDMMVILTNASNATGKKLTLGNVAFADADSVAGYAKNAVALMTGSGVVNGVDGNILPRANASRAEAAAMLSRILDVK